MTHEDALAILNDCTNLKVFQSLHQNLKIDKRKNNDLSFSFHSLVKLDPGKESTLYGPWLHEKVKECFKDCSCVDVTQLSTQERDKKAGEFGYEAHVVKVEILESELKSTPRATLSSAFGRLNKFLGRFLDKANKQNIKEELQTYYKNNKPSVDAYAEKRRAERTRNGKKNESAEEKSTPPKPARSIQEILSDIFKQIQIIDVRRKKLPRLKQNDEAVVRLAKKENGCLFDELAAALTVPPTCELYWSEGAGDALKSFYVLFRPRSAPKDFAKTGTYVASCFGKSSQPGVVAGIACGNKAKQTNPLELRKKTRFEVDVGNYNNSFLKEKVREWTPGQLETDEGVQEFTQWIQTSLNDWFEMNGKPFLLKPFLMMNLLEDNLQVILTGAPGTGKTYTAKQVAAAFVDESLDEQLLRGDADLTYDDKENVLKRYFSNPEKYFPDSKELGSKPNEFKQAVFTDSVQFHPGYDYSDFVIGMKPVLLSKNGKELVMKEGRYIVADTGNEPDPEDLAETKVSFRWKDGIFKKFAKRAKDAYEKAEDKEKAPRFVFLIDEINRADLSRVFGELFSLLEEEYRYPNGKGTDSILLPNGERFSIPKNLFIIGTMNDIDRSVESMDFALRRRFAWKEIKASDSKSIIDAKVDEGIIAERDAENLKKAMEAVNKLIAPEPSDGAKDHLRLGPEYQLGGAIFAKLEKYVGKDGDATDANANSYRELWDNHIENILREYLRGRSNRDAELESLKKAYNTALQNQLREKAYQEGDGGGSDN